ncbi:MAG: PilZ domain-containing protein [Candidatus Methylomirabilales bacterium]
MELSINQRRHRRFPFAIPLVCQASSHKERIDVGVTRNVSMGGALLDVPSPIPVWTPVKLRLLTGERVLRAHAVVVWSRQVGMGFYLGIAFTRFAPGDSVCWHKLVHYQTGPNARASVRIPVNVAVECGPGGEVGPAVPGQIGNIGEKGLLVWLPQRIPVRTELRFEFPGEKDSPSVTGEIAWVGASGHSASVPHGVQFCAEALKRDLFITAVLLGEFLRRTSSEDPVVDSLKFLSFH